MISRTQLIFIAVAVIIAAIFVAFQIQVARDFGVLALPPTYDDIGYFNDAAVRLQTLQQHGLLAVIREYIANPPHAPGSTLIAAIGFLLFGISPTSAVAANFLPLLAVVVVMLWTFRGVHIAAGATLTVALLMGVPFFGIAVVEFRPDMWCAAFIVIGTAAAALHDPRHKSVAVFVGLCAAAALLMKPTFAPLTAILFAMAWVMRLAPSILKSGNLGLAIRSALIIAGAIVVLAGPHYAIAAPRLIWYYQMHVFGAGAPLWTPDLSVAETLLYYVSGPGGRPWLGDWVPLVLGLPILLPVAVYMAGDRTLALRLCILVAVTVLAYLIVTLPGNKSAFLGVVFPAYLVGFLVLATQAGANYLNGRLRLLHFAIPVAALYLLGITAFRDPWVQLYGPYLPAESVADRQTVYREAYNTLSSDPAIRQKRVLFAQVDQYLNPENVRFRFYEMGAAPPTFIGDYFNANMETLLGWVEEADYVVTISSDYPNGLSWLPSYPLNEQINSILADDLAEVRSIQPEATSGRVLIYASPIPLRQAARDLDIGT